MIDRDDLVHLSQPKEGVAVSLYLPTERAGKPTRENPIRFKNRLAEARRLLAEGGWDDDAVSELLAPANALIDDYDFWQHQQEGLAVFVADGELERRQVPMTVPELTVVSHRYHLKPLMPLLAGGGPFWLLSVSLSEARLFRATRESLEAVALPDDTPESLDEALRFDEFIESTRQQTVRAGGEALHHGVGASDRDRKEEIGRFFTMLDNGVRQVIAGSEAPLLFAGVDFLYPLYAKANHYPHLFEEHVSGSPDGWSEDDLHGRAWEAIEGHFERPRIEALQRYKRLTGADPKQVSAEVERVVMAATEGRVDTLIAGIDAHLWGRYDARNRSIQVLDAHSLDSEDLIDLAAVETLRHGGQVYAVPREHVPDGRELAATYRF